MAAKGQGPRWSDLGSLLAVILSVAALGVSILEATTASSAAKAQAWPFLWVGETYDGAGFRYELINKGVGPARVRTITMTYRGEAVESLDTLIEDIVGPEDAFSYDRYRASTATRRVLTPGEEVVLFGVDWDPVSRRLSQSLASGISIDVCFCSVYDECWIARRGEPDPEPVGVCREERLQAGP